MTAVTYTAQRSLSVGHASAIAYTLKLVCRDIEPGVLRSSIANDSMSGVRETILFYIKRTFNVTLAPLQRGGDLDVVIEFLDSVSGGESFYFDPYGIGANAITVILTSEPYTLTRETRVGQGGGNDYFTVNFALREA